jgi:hypothetical protein
MGNVTRLQIDGWVCEMWRRLDALMDKLPPRGLAVFFLLPFLFGAIKQLFKSAPWFTDFQAIACAGNALLHGASIYAGGVECPNFWPQAYVYTPIGAYAFALIQRNFGLTAEVFLYGAIYCALLGLMLRRLWRDDGNLALRAPFLIGVSASGLLSGNISILFHVAIFLLATSFAALPIALVPLVALAGAFKPTLAVYAGLFLFTDRPWKERLLLCGASLAAMGVYFAAFAHFDAAEFAEWGDAVRLRGLTIERGHSVFGLPLIDQLNDGAALGLVYLVFAAVLGAASLLVAQTWLRDPTARICFGVSVCVLLCPRVMDYDQYTLPIGLAAMLAAALPHVARPRWVVRAALLGGLLSMILGGRRGGECLFMVACLLIVWLGALALRARRAGGRRWWDLREVEPSGV